MHARTITVYPFDELSAPAQDRALTHFATINVDCDWWESVVDDIAAFGAISALHCQYAYGKGYTNSGCYIDGICPTVNDIMAASAEAQAQYPDLYTAIIAPLLATFTPDELAVFARLERGDIAADQEATPTNVTVAPQT